MLENPDPSPVLSVAEARALLKLSRSSIYEAIRRGDIPYLKIGRRYLIPRKALQRMLEGADRLTSPQSQT